MAIFVSAVGGGKSGNLTHITTKMSTIFEFLREKSNLKDFGAAMTYIFITYIPIRIFRYVAAAQKSVNWHISCKTKGK